MYKWFFECDLACEYNLLSALPAARDVPKGRARLNAYKLNFVYQLLFKRARM